MSSCAVLATRDGPLDRCLYSVSVTSGETLISSVLPGPQHFALFLAWDARGVPDELIDRVAQALISAGLLYLVAWGPDCERVHDIFDSVDSREGPHSRNSDMVVMTTWLANEPLEEALWFVLNAAWPAEPFELSCEATFAAAVGNESWGNAIHRYLTNLPALNAAVGLADEGPSA